MAKNKTKVTEVAVSDFLGRVEPPHRQADAKVVCELMQRVSGFEPKMWGPTIVGFGQRHYRYASGREGDTLLVGFSPRKASLVFYIGAVAQPQLLVRLGKHTTGRSCLYVRSLADIDLSLLETMIERSLEAARRNEVAA